MKTGINWILKLLAVMLICIGSVACERSELAVQFREPSAQIPEKTETTGQHKIQELPLFITYHIDSIESAAEVDSFKNRFSESQQEFIFALNRMDAYRLSPGDKLVIPDTLTTNFLDYSPFPQSLEMLDSIPKTVLISRRVQGFGLYENGRLLRWGPVSSGKKSTPTPAGLFYGNYRAKEKVSTVNDSWLMPYYFNFMNFEGVGVHQYSMPGYPASHACVRLRNDDAIAIYHWANQWQLDPSGQVVRRNGTPFMVFGDYNFDQPVPWLRLAENPNSNYLTAEEMEVLRTYVTEYRKDRRNFETPVIPVEELYVPAEESVETTL